MEPAPELVALLQRYYAASAQGDTQFLDRLIARHPGTLVIGSDPAEWWRGGDQIVQTWTSAWQQRGGLPVEASQPEAFRVGDVGWVADRAVWRLPDQRIIPFRLTAVFYRADQEWRLVQAHFSVGVPNETIAETVRHNRV
jgi:SnoaL-like protein